MTDDTSGAEGVPSTGAECRTCGEPRRGSYCHACGERASHPRLDERRLAAELLGAVFTLEGRLWRTLRDVALRPGHVAREYCSGARGRYLSPIRLVLVFVLVVEGLRWLLGDAPEPFEPGTETSDIIAELTVRSMQHHGSIWLLAALPFLASALGLAFRRWRTTFAERFVLAAYTGVAWLALLAIVDRAGLFGALPAPWLFWSYALVAALHWLVLGPASRVFFEVGALTAAWRALAAILAWHAMAWFVLALVVGLVWT